MGQWLARWLREHPGAASTVAGYFGHIRLYLAPHLGGLLLGELTVEHVRGMFAAIVHDHQAQGRPIRQATVNRIRSTLRSALNTALREGLIAENPAARRPRAVVWTDARVDGPGSGLRWQCGPQSRRCVPACDRRAPSLRRLSSDRAAWAAAW
ncbi:hypothetical protein [Actinomadura rugatobispora]|uniref:Core-binding (CB) domain-containing protein n=1 Tax=Actinomadura rugatobispora TaxID=1994 RepID=A0ABW0ZS71_9ACTN